MKHFYSLSLLLLVLNFVQAQSSNRIDLNGLECAIDANGSLFQDDVNWGVFYEQGSNPITMLFTGHLWLAAKRDDTLYTAIQNYYLSGNPDYPSTDFRFGPVADDYSSAAYAAKYNWTWKLNRSDIENHKQNYQQPGYNPIGEILNWPAHGDTTNGEAWLLAPFADLNGNQIYEPLLGEFPKIRGDQSLYVIFNEADRYNPVSGLAPIGVEVHMELYAFDSILQSDLAHAVFLNYRIINRADYDLDSIFAGQWYDADLGNPFDDIVGSDSVLELSYTYNADSLDQQGFGLNPPAVGFSNLQGSVSGAMYYNNISGYNGPFATTDPISFFPHEWLLYLQNRWRDGRRLRIENPSGLMNFANGDGYDTASSYPTSNWAYNDQANWYSSPLHNSDKRQLLNFAPQSLLSGDTMCINLLINYSRDFTQYHPFAAVQKLKSEISNLQSFHQNLSYGCSSNLIGLVDNPASLALENWYPNPFQDQISIDWTGSTAQYRIINTQGQLIESGRIEKGRQILELSQLQSGLYIIQITDGQRLVKAQRVLKK